MKYNPKCEYNTSRDSISGLHTTNPSTNKARTLNKIYIKILGIRICYGRCGVYRDDGLALIKFDNGWNADIARKTSHEIFHQIGLKITVYDYSSSMLYDLKVCFICCISRNYF